MDDGLDKNQNAVVSVARQKDIALNGDVLESTAQGLLKAFMIAETDLLWSLKPCCLKPGIRMRPELWRKCFTM